MIVTDVAVIQSPMGWGHVWIRFSVESGTYQELTNLELGQVMAAWSNLWKRIAKGDGLETADPVTSITTGRTLDVFRVERTWNPETPWRLLMMKGPYKYDVYVGATVECWMAAVSAAMRFFAFKDKLITVDEEVSWNREQAAAFGLTTREDG